MPMAPINWRQGVRLAAAFLCGGLVLMGWTSAALPGRVMASIVLLAWAGVSVHGLRKQRQSFADLIDFVHSWDTRLEESELTAETLPEFDDLRLSLQQTQRHLRAKQRRQQQTVTELQGDTLLLQSVLGTMVEAVLAVDGEGRLLYVNPAAVRLLDIGAREVSGRLLSEVVRSPQLQQVVHKVLETGAEHSTELDLARQQRLATASGGPLPLSPRPGAVLVLHDVTELRRLEQARREFASNVSHELKTPLTSIQAYADTLLAGALEDSHVNRGFVERILEQSERLHHLILDLLNLSRVESREVPLELESIDLNGAVNDSVPAHQSLAATRQVSLRMELSSDAVAAIADHEALRTVLDNLVRNALNYTPAGGAVVVRVGRDAHGPHIDVEDNGVGISREHQARIFERFYRVDKARSREVGGTGLGLSIVRHFVELFGAVIELDSAQGRGSRFRIRWPTGTTG